MTRWDLESTLKTSLLVAMNHRMKDIKSAVYSLDGRTTTKESAWKMTRTRLGSIDQKKKGKRLMQEKTRQSSRLSIANFKRDEQRWLEHLGDPGLCTSHGKSAQATASDRCMLPLKDPSDEPAPRSPPESLSASTETASPISSPGDQYYETPVFNTQDYVDTPTPEQEPNQKRPDHYEEICTISSDSSYSSYTRTSSSIPVTIKYEEDILHKTCSV